MASVPRSRAIPILLVAATATLLPIGALGWLGISILRQDGEVERQDWRDIRSEQSVLISLTQGKHPRRPVCAIPAILELPRCSLSPS